MLEKLQKFARALKRDYLPARHADGSGPFSRELGICLGITWGLCGAMAFIPTGGLMPVMLILATFASNFIFFQRIQEIRKEMRSRICGEIPTSDGKAMTLSGPGMDVCVVENTQKLISKMTAGCEKAAELPPNLAAKLAPYINDSAEAAIRINANLDNAPQERIPFLRHVFNNKGEDMLAVAASILTPLGTVRKKANDYDAAVAQSIEHCQQGLPEAIKVKPLRLKKGFLSCWRA